MPASKSNPPAATRQRPAAPKPESSAAAPAAPPPATQGLALLIGLNAVNPRHYGGFDGPLRGAEHDATDLAQLAQRHGLVATVLLTAQATRAKVLGAVRKASRSLGPGDLFMMSFAGLGGQVPDVTGDEASRQDKTWCLFDAQLIVKELLLELSRFAPGVRLFLIEDTCHSGTVTRAVPMVVSDAGADALRPRLLPMAVALRTYREHQAYYDRAQADLVRTIKLQVTADEPPAATRLEQLTESALTRQLASHFAPALVALTAVQDNQTAQETATGGVFTQALLTTLQRSGPPAGLDRLTALVRALLPATQSPFAWTMGPAARWLKKPLFEA